MFYTHVYIHTHLICCVWHVCVVALCACICGGRKSASDGIFQAVSTRFLRQGLSLAWDSPDRLVLSDSLSRARILCIHAVSFRWVLGIISLIELSPLDPHLYFFYFTAKHYQLPTSLLIVIYLLLYYIKIL